MFKKGSESVETRQSSGGSELKETERIWGSGLSVNNQMGVLEFNVDRYQIISFSLDRAGLGTDKLVSYIQLDRAGLGTDKLMSYIYS